VFSPTAHRNILPASPVLKWAGGKRRLLGQYEEHFPQKFGSYFEPFVGGGAVFFWLHSFENLARKSVVLNDINPELVNLYKILKTDCESLIEKLALHHKHHGEEHYYRVRAKNHKRMKPVNRAARLLYLNRTCFNGLYRVNSKGQFNVPMGRYKNPLICDPKGLRAASAALQDTVISLGTYKDCTRSATQGDFVYFDPPYVPLNTTSSFTSYTKENFGLKDQEELAETFAELAARGVKVLLSNSDTPLVRDLYKEFKQHSILAPRAINSKPDRRQKVSELLIES
jgi:DNA adenine methylase